MLWGIERCPFIHRITGLRVERHEGNSPQEGHQRLGLESSRGFDGAMFSSSEWTPIHAKGVGISAKRQRSKVGRRAFSQERKPVQMFKRTKSLL